MTDPRSRCRVVRSDETFTGLQGLSYRAGLTGESAGTRGICMTVAVLPPGARAKAHLHRGIETAVYVIEGEAETWFGERLEDRAVGRAGDYIYIPPDLPHLVINRSETRCVAVVAHSAADDQAGIELRPDLDGRV